MKKILMIGMAGVLVLLSILAYGLIDTGAWFSDTVSSTGNQLTAATLKLSVNESRGTRQTYALDNIRPGDWQLGGQAIVKNDGTIPGHLWYEIENISPADGLLGELVYLKFQANVEPWTHYGGDDGDKRFRWHTRGCSGSCAWRFHPIGGLFPLASHRPG